MNQLFVEHKNNPPISKNQPLVAGSIAWSKSLFQRIKHTVVRLRTMKELISTPKGKQVSTGNKYLLYVHGVRRSEAIMHIHVHMLSNLAHFIRTYVRIC